MIVRICRICSFRMARGTYHCRSCDVCVRNYDHHCPWTSKCIGGSNLRRFYVFVTITPLYLIYYAVMILVAFASKEALPWFYFQLFSGKNRAIISNKWGFVSHSPIFPPRSMFQSWYFFNDFDDVCFWILTGIDNLAWFLYDLLHSLSFSLVFALSCIFHWNDTCFTCKNQLDLLAYFVWSSYWYRAVGALHSVRFV